MEQVIPVTVMNRCSWSCQQKAAGCQLSRAHQAKTGCAPTQSPHQLERASHVHPQTCPQTCCSRHWGELPPSQHQTSCNRRLDARTPAWVQISCDRHWDAQTPTQVQSCCNRRSDAQTLTWGRRSLGGHWGGLLLGWAPWPLRIPWEGLAWEILA